MLREVPEKEPHPIVHHEEKPTEEMVCVPLTVPHHLDNQGTMPEEQAGTGKPESMGG